jgi:hypothetical protein
MRLAILTAAMLAGCATVIPPHQATNEDVCRNLAIPEYAPTAQQEARRRGLDCGPYFAQREAQSRALNNAAQFFNRPAPAIQPSPRPLNCTSYRVGNTVQTDCH